MSETLFDESIIAETRPENPRRGMTSAAMAPARFMKDSAQGACAGLLTLAGATQLSSGAAFANVAAGVDAISLQNLGMQLVAGNITGVLQIAGAAALFLMAGRGIARVLGLLVFVAAATAYFNGVEVSEIVEQSQRIYQALLPAYATFQEALMSS